MFPGLWSREEKVHVCSEREREGGSGGRKKGWGGLSSPAYRSTKDNLTLPLGLLPRLPTWHSFYFCSSPLLSVSRFLPPALLSSPKIRIDIFAKIRGPHSRTFPKCLLLRYHIVGIHSAGFLAIQESSYRNWFIGRWRKQVVSNFLKDLRLTVISPPTRSFVWGSSSLVPSCGE